MFVAAALASVALAYAGHPDNAETVTTCMETAQTGSEVEVCLSDVQGSACAFRCTQKAIRKYWECAADCVARQAPDWCITQKCQAEVVAFDVPCLKGCNSADTIQVDSFLQ